MDLWSAFTGVLIDDPVFYAVAVPAVLLVGLSKSGFLSGFGSLATPLMAMTVPVPQAAAIMLPLLVVMDLLNIRELFGQRDRALVRLLIPAGLVGVGLGALLFGVFSNKAVAGVVGALTLLFLLQRLLMKPRPDGAPPSRGLGRVLGAASGFTSFVAHAGGPPISAYVLPLRLAPVVASATMATFFAAINLAKWVPYAWLGLVDARNMATALVLLPVAPLGIWIGVWLLKRVRTDFFYKLAYAGMAAAGLQLLWEGLR